jgi:hypothetical protein
MIPQHGFRVVPPPTLLTTTLPVDLAADTVLVTDESSGPRPGFPIAQALEPIPAGEPVVIDLRLGLAARPFNAERGP